ncbi:MAG: hypothetical protein NWR21_03635, partial [Verrucomicrobiales bacterium]|nr:hypothetical protein [Verrucomicrobiales bacterium]
MKTSASSQLFRAAALFLFLVAGWMIPLLAQQEKPAAADADSNPASPWTATDTRLANHYIQLLQKDPAYGNVLDLLWALYGKKDQASLLLEYFKGASESGPTVAKLIYAHL